MTESRERPVHIVGAGPAGLSAALAARSCGFDETRARIWLTTPYLVLDSATQRELCTAAARGADVQVLMPGKNDVPLGQWAGRAAYSGLPRAGVRLFEYQPRIDYRSFFIDYELNLVARSASLDAALAGAFEDDPADAREICKRPWVGRPLRRRAAELMGSSARHWL